MRISSDRWQRVAEIYESLSDLEADERETRLVEICAGDAEVLSEVRSLLAQDAKTSPLDRPVWVAENLFVLPSSLAIGSAVGPYVVKAILGAGGMGEVYRASDSKLGRDVALKILPKAHASDPERRARFEREAHILASLNHPHIAAIHGVEDSGTIHALVLELVEGQTLAERLESGALRTEDAITIALQIVDALESAHERGVVHRDLKPANIKIRPDGTVKVLDFGLARLADAGTASAAHLTASPTVTSPSIVTGAGMILGTAAYMSPEQAKGRSADARSDVWAFGCVLFEMLTGTRPFGGEDVAETVAAVLRSEPDFEALPLSTPLGIRRLLTFCLRKDRRRRLAAIADARLELEMAAMDDPPARSISRWPQWAGVLAMAAFILLAVLLLRARSGHNHTAHPVRLSIAPPDGEMYGGPQPPYGGTGVATQLAISPDGQHVVFVARGAEQSHLWLRSLAAEPAIPLPDTDGASFPFWSPDSTQIAFFADDKLKTVRLSGGPATVVCDAPAARGGSWSPENTIVFSPFAGDRGLLQIPVGGGVAANITEGGGGTSHRWPWFLPDGTHFLYTATSGPCCPATRPAVVMIGSLAADEPPASLMQVESSVFYAAGRLFFAREATSTLMAQSFDPVTRRLSGEPFPVAENISFEGSRYAGASGSANGTIVYGHVGDEDTVELLTWFDRRGRPVGTGLTIGRHEGMSLSPNGLRLAVSQFERKGDASEIWQRDLVTGHRSRLTSNAGFDRSPVWSGDGKSLAYLSERAGTISLREMSSQGTGDRELLQATDLLTVSSWSPDNGFLAFTRRGSNGFADVWAIAVKGGREPFPVVATAGNDSAAVFSPDSRWIAFSSTQGGPLNVFVQRFPEGGETHLVSETGAGLPLWKADGRELFYLAATSPVEAVLTSVPIESLEPFMPGPRTELFRIQTGDVRGDSAMGLGRLHAVAADGQRFLISTRRPPKPAIAVIVNWDASARP